MDAEQTTTQPNQLFAKPSKADFAQVARGFLMGGADIIPGVSGGTVALIVGIYDRLVTAISHFDLTVLNHLKRREWIKAAEHVDLRFLIALGCGIVAGIGGLVTLMHYLLDHQREPTFGAFFGLILGSSMIVAGRLQKWSPANVVCLIVGSVGAFYIVGLPFLQSPPEGNAYIFFCGMVGICAMILPGISGAFILLILGRYAYITETLKGLLHGDITPESVTTVAVFCAGCGIGLVSFSKLLRWLLARYEAPTMALLCGFMLGSLRKIWPFKRDLTPDVEKFKLKQFENIMPEQFDGSVMLVIALAVVGFVLVLGLERYSNKNTPNSTDA